MFLKRDAVGGHGQEDRTTLVYRRQSGLSHNTEGVIVFAVIAGFFLCGGLILAFVLRHLRVRHSNPKYVPGTWLKARWRAWIPSSEKKRYSSSLQDRRSIQMAGSASPGSLELNANGQWVARGFDGTSGGSNSQNAVDRNTSVRSTITLPAYSANARATETIMGREGERAGIDTVVEFPESLDEEEARRDEEMESLYQIRRARREERATREERRRLRREARARGDAASLEALRAQSQSARHGENGSAAADAAAGVDRPSAALIQEHQNRDRGRRVPTVAYSDLGVARHDGSRVRANSNESDRPLLDAAAAMGGANDNRPRSASSNTLQPYFRNASTSSLRRFTTPDYSDDDGESDLERVGTPRRSSTPSQSRVASRDGRGDVQSLMEPEPPQYEDVSDGPREVDRAATSIPQEDAPPYESPITNVAPGLPLFSNLPAIEITPTPWSPVAREN